jgi:hypothetical protein
MDKEHYSVIKKNETVSFTVKWMELESIMLNEISQISHALAHLWNQDLK